MKKRKLTSLLLGRKGRSVLYVLVALGAFLFIPKPPELLGRLLEVIVVITVLNLLERFFLWDEYIHLLSDATREVGKSLSQVVASAVDCGLTGIYVNRKKAVGEVKAAITDARSRVWIMGVALASELSLSDLAPILSEKIKSGTVDVKILLLDPLRSPAVFRTFLESPLEEVGKIANSDRTPGIPEALFWQTFYRDFQNTVYELQLEENVELSKRVKFYGHDPCCWMVVTDDVTYFEPYTFGSPSNGGQRERPLGSYLPVLRFQREPSAEPFNILENHFIKLWLTSDMTFLHIVQRWEDKHAIVKEVFDRRGKWLREVYETLKLGNGNPLSCDQDRRAWSRQTCISTPPSVVTIENKDQNWESDAEVQDSSWGGIALKLDHPIPHGIKRVKLTPNTTRGSGQSSKGVLLLLHWFLNQDYDVAWVQDSPMLIGLKRSC
jgi:hypothetical protein